MKPGKYQATLLTTLNGKPVPILLTPVEHRIAFLWRMEVLFGLTPYSLAFMLKRKGNPFSIGNNLNLQISHNPRRN